MDYNLTGSRLVEIKFGLLADLPLRTPYTTPYYLLLVFRKGVEDYNEFYPVSVLSPIIGLRDLGKIVKHTHRQDNKALYTFTDDLTMVINV